MDRYQFEGYISDYIENVLSISKRKEFEQFMAENVEARDQVEAVRKTIQGLNNLPKVKTSADFMVKLKSRITQHPDITQFEQKNRRPLIFGFTPLTATMMSLVVLAIVFVGYELLPSGTSTSVAIPSQITANNVLPSSVSTTPMETVNTKSTIAEAADDSLFDENESQQKRPDFDDKINYVKTQ